LGDKVAFYGQLGAGYNNTYSVSKTDYPGYSDQTNRKDGYYASLSPGFVLFPTENIGLELSVGGMGYYHLADTKKDNENRFRTVDTSFNFRFGLSSLHLGASYYLGR
jgi:hypothetical protein